jgi:ABC-type uncharacterized transport system involved in gliding motility auxiliary subunit
MFPVTITITNTAQLNAVMSALNIDAQPVATTTSQVKKDAAAPVEKPKGAPAKTEAPAPTSRTAEVEKPAAPEKKVEPSTTTQVADAPAASDSTATYQDAAAAITKLSRTKGRDAAVAVLQQFGATKLPDVKPEQFAAVVAAAEAALGA